jgi:PAS domain S-box-containing protein
VHSSTSLVLLCLLLGSFAEAQIKSQRVLMLNEAGTAWPGINLIDQGIRAALETSPRPLEFYREYLDTIFFPDLADQQRFREFYVRKYRDRRPDVIITIGPSPLQFMVETHSTAFPSVPIVFCYPNWTPGSPILDSDFAGVENELAPSETIEAALRLQPGTRHIILVEGTSFHDVAFNRPIEDSLRTYERKLEVSYLKNLTMPDLLERLKRLPKQTIVVSAAFTQDAAGSEFTSGKASALGTAAANSPVFTVVDSNFDHGEVGGKLSSLREQGRIAGELALRILQGEKPQDIPGVNAGTTYMFDWRALKRWGMKQSKLPWGSIVVHREPTVWESYKWYIVSGLCLLLAQTSIIGLLWQRDRRRRAETELAITYDRLRLAVEAGKSVGWDWDIKTGQDRWFGDLQTVFGIPSDSYSGKVEDFHRRVHPEDRGLVGQAVTAARQKRTPYFAEFRVIREDKTVRWLAARGRFYYGNNGVAERMLGMAVDITERRLAEIAVRESEERFRLVANTAPVMIWMSGIDKMCNYFNKPWLDFTGRALEQELGNGWTQGVYSEDFEVCLKTYTEAFDRREQFEMQYRLRRHDGEYRWISDIGVPRFSDDGTFTGYIGSCIDVTERKRASEALSTIGRRLIEAHEQERTWIGRELHDDIGQRLAMLSVELDQWSHENSTNGNFPERLSQARRQVADIAEDVQALSHRLHSSKLDYLGLASAARSFCKELSEQVKVEIQFSQSAIPATIPQEVSLSLFRVLQEALQNAVKHSGARTFQVNLRGAPNGIELTVSDEGKGFDENNAVFSRGLGLISMRERVQMVNGVFNITTHPGEGTTVSARVLLPMSAHRALAG